MSAAAESFQPAQGAEGPLSGLTVVVTRTAEQAAALADPLRALGAEVIAMPVIEIADMPDSTEIDEAIANIDRYDWLVLTSTNAVDRFFARLSTIGPPAEVLRDVSVAAVGPVSAARVQSYGVEPAVVPKDFRAEGVVEALGARRIGSGSRVLIPRAAEARDVLPEQLGALGAEVDAIDLYRLVPAEPDPEALERIGTGQVDVLIFASGATARHFVGLLEAQGFDAASVSATTDIASIGPVTSAAIRELGFSVDIEAQQQTVDALVAEIVRRLGHEDNG